MRLIDADELMKRMCSECLIGKCERRCYEWHLMNDAPTVDAVEVVRCKDCSSWGTRTVVIDNNKCTVACDCLNFGAITKPDFFCAWGEKGDVDRTKSGEMDEVEEC